MQCRTPLSAEETSEEGRALEGRERQVCSVQGRTVGRHVTRSKLMGCHGAPNSLRWLLALRVKVSSVGQIRLRL